MALPVITYLYGFPILDPSNYFFYALDDGAFQPATTTELTLETMDGVRIVFKGDFTVDGMGVVTGGTMTSFKVFGGSTRVMKGDGYEIAATDLISAIEQWQMSVNEPLDDLLLEIPTKFVGSDQIDQLFGDTPGTKLLGKDGDDFLWAGTTDQTLKGGKGNDFLFADEGFCLYSGGKGEDVFAFVNPAMSNEIKDLSPEDRILLDSLSFAGVPFGFLDESQFKVGNKAKTPDEIIIYSKQKGAIYFDVDGSGPMEQVEFAQVPTGLGLTASNFYGEPLAVA